MILFLAALFVLLTGALVTALAGRRSWTNTAGPLFSVAGSVLTLVGSLMTLVDGRWEWMPSQAENAVLSIHLAMDPLSAFFCAVTALITGVASVYGSGYLNGHAHGKNLGVSWAFFLVLSASMLLVETAWNGIFFLVAWEIMSLSSFFLVVFDGEKPDVLKAGWIYLVATHFATAFLMVMFMILGSSGSFSLSSAAVPPAMKSVVFILALIGFGTKAGLAPFHVWLPEAHPAAPSHVSAVMSGVMVKAGIYGILRIVSLSGGPFLWWGWLLLIAGAVTGVGGVLFALAQKDLKRLLAYSTVENIGIIALGLGLGLIGMATGHPVMTVLGLSGCLMHVLNHAVFKSLLFFGAGSVLHATGSKNMEIAGGLMKRMGKTGAFFMTGSAAICALPPFNGFVGEFLIYLGSFRAFSVQYKAQSVLAGILAISALALIGGLAAACFTRATGVVFLGEPRSAEASDAVESNLAMTAPMAVLACLCLVLGLAGPFTLSLIQPAVQVLAGRSPFMDAIVRSAGFNLLQISLAGLGFLILVLVLRSVKNTLLAKRGAEQGITWDCGYTAPDVRMQYTASSFSDPVVTMFNAVLRSEKHLHRPEGLFPQSASVETRTSDVVLARLFTPLFTLAAWAGDRLHGMKKGYNQIYILYMVLALFALLLWTFFQGYAQ